MALEWRPVVGFENYYEVSSDGVVRRTARGKRTRQGFILKARVAPNGYLVVKLCGGAGRQARRTTHKVVADAFLGPRPAGHEVNHKDGLKTNNAVSNLEYVTKKENHQHAFRLGLRGVGSEIENAKMTERGVLVARHLRDFGVSYVELAKWYGVSTSTMQALCKGRQWAHVGGPIDTGDSHSATRISRTTGRLVASA